MSSEKIRLGIVGGGIGAFVGSIHRIAARLDDRYELLAGALSSEPRRAADSAAELGIDPRRAYASFEEMAKKSASIALTFMMSSCFGAKALAFAGNTEQKQELLPRLARGETMFAISVTEPDGGTDVLNVMKTTARAEGDDFIINGSKVPVIGAEIIDISINIISVSKANKESR